MKQKILWLNQIKGLCICLGVIYHSVITFYPQLNLFQHPWSQTLSKCWVYFNLYLAPFRMPVFFFISGYLIRHYIDEVPWKESIDKRILSIVYVLTLWGVLQWTELSVAVPERDLTNAANAAYAGSWVEFLQGMLTTSTSLCCLSQLSAAAVVGNQQRRFSTRWVPGMAPARRRALIHALALAKMAQSLIIKELRISDMPPCGGISTRDSDTFYA